jgi:hypothetical protein
MEWSSPQLRALGLRQRIRTHPSRSSKPTGWRSPDHHAGNPTRVRHEAVRPHPSRCFPTTVAPSTTPAEIRNLHKPSPVARGFLHGRLSYACRAPETLHHAPETLHHVGVRTGFLHWYVSPEQVKLVNHSRPVSTYAWRSVAGGQHFCPICGIAVYRTSTQYPPPLSVNARCIEDVDVSKLNIRRHDGKHLYP